MDWKKLGTDILEKIKTTRILGIIALVLLYGGLMLPFVGIEYKDTATASWVDQQLYDNGKGIMLLWILSVVLMFSDVIAANWPKGSKIFSKLTNPKILLIPVIITLIVLIVTQVKFFDDYDYFEDDIYLYPGYFLNWLGMIAMTAYAFLYKGNNAKKDSEE